MALHPLAVYFATLAFLSAVVLFGIAIWARSGQITLFGFGALLFALVLGRFGPRVFPSGVSTMGALATATAASSFGILAKSIGAFRTQDVWPILVRLAVEQSGCDDNIGPQTLLGPLHPEPNIWAETFSNSWPFARKK